MHIPNLHCRTSQPSQQRTHSELYTSFAASSNLNPPLPGTKKEANQQQPAHHFFPLSGLTTRTGQAAVWRQWSETDPNTVRMEEDNAAGSHALLKKLGGVVVDAGRSPPPKIPCRAIALRGDPRDEIPNKADELKARMLIMGSRGMGAITR
ncbi:hypothetical protein BDK51DRAFT_50422 [Blyttiomyces helicus]|uniref:Uncharacterized protein n=1 Tax=Blyttiomyces helicus TaxID=388810 RepID=A0A4P9VYX0_9FUNG|nr:hypothetical protein BDK51DRAFT_50422 [Blyttiomyces helicus]|eukprot:RKO83528.1 hypothetical protein BDK51DRAFT_50422 [Blyttiomyces helicus]